jgi:hypothetical protein
MLEYALSVAPSVVERVVVGVNWRLSRCANDISGAQTRDGGGEHRPSDWDSWSFSVSISSSVTTIMHLL